jgi:Phycobilisome degradation protein nblA
MDTTVELSIEQEFMMRIYEEQVKNLSLQEAQDYLLTVLRQSMAKENLFKRLIRSGI